MFIFLKIPGTAEFQEICTSHHFVEKMFRKCLPVILSCMPLMIIYCVHLPCIPFLHIHCKCTGWSCSTKNSSILSDWFDAFYLTKFQGKDWCIGSRDHARYFTHAFSISNFKMKEKSTQPVSSEYFRFESMIDKSCQLSRFVNLNITIYASCLLETYNVDFKIDVL